jgi:hypothetical protein
MRAVPSWRFYWNWLAAARFRADCPSEKAQTTRVRRLMSRRMRSSGLLMRGFAAGNAQQVSVFSTAEQRLSFPKISSARIRAMRQNQRIILRDAWVPSAAWDVYRRIDLRQERQDGDPPRATKPWLLDRCSDSHTPSGAAVRWRLNERTAAWKIALAGKLAGMVW